MEFHQNLIQFYRSLNTDLKLPRSVSLIYPFKEPAVWDCFTKFCNTFYSGDNERILLLGINPGRFGAGITGIPFTDPYHLEHNCGIVNRFEKRKELSSIYIYDIIEQLGGPLEFYKHFYISSMCPLGFLKDGKNYNYYDDIKLYKAVKKFMINSIDKQLEFPCSRKIAFSLGKGKNYKILLELNKDHKWFEEVIPLAHPRWVMQYQRKNYEKHLISTCSLLAKATD